MLVLISSFSSFYFIPDCSSEKTAAHIQLTQSRKSLPDYPELCFHGDCKSHQLTFQNDVLSYQGLSF